MTDSGLSAAQKVAYAFIDAHFPWLPKPTIKEDPDASNARYHATATEIFVPRYSDAWNDGREDILIHEVGHVLAFWLTAPPRNVPVIEPWLAAMGAPAALIDDPLVNEMWAEHFARTYCVGYRGANYPALVDRIPFHVQTNLAFFQGLANLVTLPTLPTLLIPVVPERVAPILPQVVAPAPTNSVTSTYDVRDELPRTDWEIGRHAPKTSRTYHWNGPALPTDVHPLDLILNDAHYHVSKDWSPAPGIQGGDGIMYHKLIAPNGDLYITRDADAVLWACDSEIGNAQSEHVQVMIGDGQQPSTAQLATMARLEQTEPLGDTFPHRFWSATACPGEDITAWVNARAWNSEEDMAFKDDPDATAYRADVLASFTAHVVAIGDLTHRLAALEGDDTIDDAAMADLKARLDRLRTI